MKLTDKYNRRHNYLRISLTDKCNLNCLYCNPSDSQSKTLPNREILSFEEILRIIDVFSSMGFDKFRFTGGEPLARKEVDKLFQLIKPLKKERHFELAMTTNAILLENKIDSLLDNGLDRINISLDSLNTNNFKKITGSDSLGSVISAIEKAMEKGIKLKINTVVMKGINDSELLDFCRFSLITNINIRFIEFMPFSNNGWEKDRFISSGEMKKFIEEEFKLEKTNNDSIIAEDYIISGTNRKISFINSISNHFCSQCNRLRLTSDGKLKLCLFSREDELLDLKRILNEPDEEITQSIMAFMQLKKSEHAPIEELIKLKNNNMLKIGG